MGGSQDVQVSSSIALKSTQPIKDTAMKHVLCRNTGLGKSIRTGNVTALVLLDGGDAKQWKELSWQSSELAESESS